MITRLGGQAVTFPIVDREVRSVIPRRLATRLARASYLQLRKAEEYAVKRSTALMKRVALVNPRFAESETRSLRAQFTANARDMSPFVLGEKDPIPDPGDLVIIVQASKLVPGRAMILSRDAHFVAYQDLIAKWLSVEVEDANRLPLTLEEWRGP